jgi:hypothetical protein
MLKIIETLSLSQVLLILNIMAGCKAFLGYKMNDEERKREALRLISVARTGNNIPATHVAIEFLLEEAEEMFPTEEAKELLEIIRSQLSARRLEREVLEVSLDSQSSGCLSEIEHLEQGWTGYFTPLFLIQC